MSSRNRGRGDPSGSTDALLHAADTFAARPAEEVMDELGLSREKAEQWQRICAELAQAVRAELASTNSRPRAIRQRRNSNSNSNTTGDRGSGGAERHDDVSTTQTTRH